MLMFFNVLHPAHHWGTEPFFFFFFACMGFQFPDQGPSN